MHATTVAGAAAIALFTALAGCTGGFQVDQTEPFRVQIDGAPQTVVVREGDAEAKRVVVQTCEGTVRACDVEQVEVQVEVRRTSSTPCRILVDVQDEDGNSLGQKVIEVGGAGAGDGDGGTGANGTGNGTTTAGNGTMTGSGDGGGDVVIQAILVDARGKNNIVVVTQAQQGEANVNINAVKTAGQGNDVDIGDGGTMTTSETMTASETETMTTSETMTTTSQANTTTGP